MTGHRGKLVALAALLLASFIGFIALGTWQLERRVWKLELIRRVEARVHAPASDAPGPSAWPGLRAADVEYSHVRVSGSLQPAASTSVQAVTELGPGYWIMTPLVRADDGSTVLVNRGWVADAETARAARLALATVERDTHAAPVTITGLLRASEPGGGFLHRNDPAGDRWYSRDVVAIAAARGLRGAVAPYFIDAAAAPNRPADSAAPEPVGGLTVIAFHNSHLVYALTWFGLAALVCVGGWQLWRTERRSTRMPASRAT